MPVYGQRSFNFADYEQSYQSIKNCESSIFLSSDFL